MDRLSFVFSLLLIVSVTSTFGSVIKAKNPTKEELEELRSDPDSSPYHEMPRNSKIEALQSDVGLDHYPEMVPNRQELEALLKRSHGPKSLRDQDSEMPKFKDVPEPEADVIPGHDLTPTRLEEFLNSLQGGYVVAIGIDNESGFTWSKFPTYFSSGTEDKTLPYHLPYESAVLYGALSAGGSEEPATIGVLTYYIPSIGKTLGVMWSDPHSGPNTWNIRLYDGQKTPDSDMYRDLYDHGAMGPGEEGKALGSGLKFTGELSGDGGRVTLKILVKPDITVFRKTSKLA